MYAERQYIMPQLVIENVAMNGKSNCGTRLATAAIADRDRNYKVVTGHKFYKSNIPPPVEVSLCMGGY